jgi:hypothetical protein
MKFGSDIRDWNDDPSVLAQLFKRGRYVGWALVIHVLVLALLYQVGPRRAAALNAERELSASASLTRNARTQQRVRDLDKIKSLLEESNGATADAAQRDEAREPEPLDFSATTLPEQPKELLAQARELAKQIDQLDKELQAESLAEVLKVPKEEALKRLESAEQAQPAPASDSSPMEGPGETGEQPASAHAQQAPADQAPPVERMDDAGAAAEIERLERRAMDALRRRHQQLARQSKGVPANTPPPGAGRGTGLGSDRIVRFLNRDVPVAKIERPRYADSGMGLFHQGTGAVPPVDFASMRKGTGRTMGAGGQLTNRMYLNTWYLIGPFEGKHGRGMFDNYRHPPEDGVILDAVYPGKEGRLLKWQYVSRQEYPLVPPDHAEDAVYYGYTELMSDEDMEASAWFGADDDAQVWLNDEKIWVGGNINKAWFFGHIYDTQNTHVRDFNLTEGRRDIRLRKGRNKVFFKLSNGPTRVFFSMVLEPKR